MAFKFSLAQSNGEARSAYFGFAWTTLLFGPLASLARKDFSIAFITMVLEIIACAGIFLLYDHNAYLLAVRLAIVTFCWALLYNEIHALGLLVAGFKLQGPDDVVAALNDKYPATGRSDRLRLLQTRSLLLVGVSLGLLQVSVPLLPTGGQHVGAESPTPVKEASRSKQPETPTISAQPEPKAASGPVAAAPSPSPTPVASPRPVVIASPSPPAPKQAPAEIAPPKPVPSKSAAEVLAEQQRQCDMTMGNQFDPDLPKNFIPVATTSTLSETDVDQAIANCEGARRGGSRRINTQLGRAYAAKAMLLTAQGKDDNARATMTSATMEWQAAARQGSATAKNFLGAYYGGTFNTPKLIFVPPDYPTALDYWRAAAADGNPKAARNAGALLLIGPPDYPKITQDVVTARHLLESADQSGDPTAAGILGRAFYSGSYKGITKDPKRGQDLLTRACAGGDSGAREFYDSDTAKKQNLTRPPGC
jgi:outer membrane biosynthesis protein TonB